MKPHSKYSSFLLHDHSSTLHHILARVDNRQATTAYPRSMLIRDALFIVTRRYALHENIRWCPKIDSVVKSHWRAPAAVRKITLGSFGLLLMKPVPLVCPAVSCLLSPIFVTAKNAKGAVWVVLSAGKSCGTSEGRTLCCLVHEVMPLLRIEREKRESDTLGRLSKRLNFMSIQRMRLWTGDQEGTQLVKEKDIIEVGRRSFCGVRYDEEGGCCRS